jgi:hypothetical protein
LVATRFLESCGYLLIVDIGDTLEKEQRENIRFEICRVNWPSQDVGCLPKVSFQGLKIKSGT